MKKCPLTSENAQTSESAQNCAFMLKDDPNVELFYIWWFNIDDSGSAQWSNFLNVEESIMRKKFRKLLLKRIEKEKGLLR